MRTLLLAALFTFLPMSASAQIGAANDASTPEPDQRVQAALDADDWNYEIDGDGDFKLVVGFSNEDRSQLVWVRSTTLTVSDMEIREIWSPVYANGNSQSVPPDVAQWAIEESWNLTIGSLAADAQGTVYVVSKIDAIAQSSILSSVIRVTASTGDELEKVYSADDDL